MDDSTSVSAPPTPGPRSQPLRVAVLSVGWPMETFILRLLTGLADRGLAITIVSRGRPPSTWLREHGISWVLGPDRLSPRRLAGQARRNGVGAALRSFSRERPGTDPAAWGVLRAADVVYAPWINTLTDRPHLLHLGPPVVTSCRGSQITVAPWRPGNEQHRDRLPEVFDAAVAVHCVSEAIREEARSFGLDRAKAVTIRPAVDPATFRPGSLPPSDRLRLVAVGNLDWRKDLEHALVAVRRVNDLGIDVGLKVIGDGRDAQHLRFAIDDLDLGDRVELLGRQAGDDVADHLRSSDVFLHTSATEGISNAVLEAMATGLPVVTTDAGGMREAVRDGLDGRVVPVRDASATADALVDLAGDPERRRAMGASARQRVLDDFDLRDQVDAFVSLFEQVSGRVSSP